MLIYWFCNPDGPTLVGSHPVDCRDVAKAVVASLTAPPTSQVGRKWTLVNGHWFNGRNAVEIIARHRRELKPRLSRHALAEEPPGEHYPADRSRAREVLGIAEYIAWEETVFGPLDSVVKLQDEWNAKGLIPIPADPTTFPPA